MKVGHYRDSDTSDSRLRGNDSWHYAITLSGLSRKRQSSWPGAQTSRFPLAREWLPWSTWTTIIRWISS